MKPKLKPPICHRADGRDVTRLFPLCCNVACGLARSLHPVSASNWRATHKEMQPWSCSQSVQSLRETHSRSAADESGAGRRGPAFAPPVTVRPACKHMLAGPPRTGSVAPSPAIRWNSGKLTPSTESDSSVTCFWGNRILPTCFRLTKAKRQRQQQPTPGGLHVAHVNQDQ